MAYDPTKCEVLTCPEPRLKLMPDVGLAEIYCDLHRCTATTASSRTRCLALASAADGLCGTHRKKAAQAGSETSTVKKQGFHYVPNGGYAVDREVVAALIDPIPDFGYDALSDLYLPANSSLHAVDWSDPWHDTSGGRPRVERSGSLLSITGRTSMARSWKVDVKVWEIIDYGHHMLSRSWSVHLNTPDAQTIHPTGTMLPQVLTMAEAAADTAHAADVEASGAVPVRDNPAVVRRLGAMTDELIPGLRDQ